MDNKIVSVKKICMVLLSLYVFFAAAFYFIAQYQIKYTADEEVFIGEEADSN